MKKCFSYIQIDKKKGILGAVLAAFALGICLSWESRQIYGVPVALMFLVIGFIRLELQNWWGILALNLLWGLACILTTIQLSFAAVDVLISDVMSLSGYLLNILIFLIAIGAVFLMTTNWKSSVTAATFFLAILALANHFVYQFRGNELVFTDFRAIGTALNVAGQYVPQVTRLMFYFLFAYALSLFSQFSIPSLPKIPRRRTRFVTLGLEAVFLLTLWLGAADMRYNGWTNGGTRSNGYYLNFLLGIRDSFVETPDNYSMETLQHMEGFYTAAPDNTELRSTPPNIIIIMNEAYADLRILGGELRTNTPVAPFADALQENVIRGYALGSVFGGGTANSEFELLTGHTMAFLTGTTPYQQFIYEESYSLVRILDAYGYTSLATHPYHANGWSRTRVYPNLGFDKSTFVEDYPQEKLVRDFVSDQELFEYVLEALDIRGKQQPLFLFCVTMQNHSSYDYTGGNYAQTIHLEGYSQEYPEAEQYLTLINLTDAALEYLLTFLEEYPEDTVVLFFGDHFPRIENSFYEELHGSAFDTLDEQQLQYTVPFLIWANYDIPERTVELTSLNYLGRYLLEAAGLELPPYYQFLAELEQTIPAINAMGYYSLEKSGFIPFEKASGEEADWLNRYAILQYNNMFDADNRSQLFFGQYLPAAVQK